MELKNYAAQAVIGMESHVKERSVNSDFSELIQSILPIIKTAVHFQMPNNGKILQDHLKGLEGMHLNLPFKKITIALSTDALKDNVPSTAAALLIAQQVPNHVVPKNILNAHNEFNFIEQEWIIVSAIEQGSRRWHPIFGAVFIPTVNWGKMVENIGTETCSIRFLVLDAMNAHNEFGDTVEIIQRHRNNLMQSARAVLELIEALSCSNVTHEPVNIVNKANNDKRIRKGKVPFYEVRTLVVDSGKSHNVVSIGGHREHGNKQHLCRGHIRRHPTAGNIWINSHVRGSAALGVIEKNYDVRKSA